MLRVCVTGGRTFSDRKWFDEELDALHSGHRIVAILEGGASGADELAVRWARAHEVPIETFTAHWQLEGRSAGPIRNRRMLDARPDLVIAFPGGPGTAHCLEEARHRGIAIHIAHH